MAIEAADQLLAESQAGTEVVLQPSCRLIRAWIRLARGDLPGALEDAGSAAQLAHAAELPMDLYWALGVRGRILVAAGRIKEANAQASELLAMLVERGAPLTAPDSSGDLAVVLQALGRATDFQGLAQTWTATPWRQVATAIAAGDFKQAADPTPRSAPGPMRPSPIPGG